MQTLDLERPGEFDRVRRAADVHRRVDLSRRRHVVDGRQVEEVADLPAQLAHPLLLDAQERPAEIPDHRFDPFGRRRTREDPPALDQILQPLERALAHEHVDLALTRQKQPLY